MATTPTFTSTARADFVNVASANTARDGTGTIATLMTGAAAGTKVFEINIQATATTTAGMVRIFISSNDGTTWRLFDEISVPAATPSATVKASRNSTLYNNLILPSATHRLGVTTHNAESINVIALSGDLT
jgi:hypothetical protein